MSVYKQILTAKKYGNKKFAVLIDPDQIRVSHLDKILQTSIDANVDYFLIGGSLIVNNMLDEVLKNIKQECDIPVVLFPGNSFQISYQADAILFLSLISGRNADLLIGKHVITAPFLKVSPLEVISTGYMLIDGGVATTVSYISNTTPIPSEKTDIALCTAMAGEMLGLKMLYMDAGSGARKSIPVEMTAMVSQAIDIPLVVGGGIRSPEIAREHVLAGADMIVVGNAVEKNPQLIMDMSAAIHSVKSSIY